MNMKLFDVYPLNAVTIARAVGSYVWDDAGMRYLDMYGGHAVISIGHTHPHWVVRIKSQLEKIAFYSNSVHIPLQEELAILLGRISGKEDYQLFLCNSGAEANENALKLASFHTGRKKIIAFTGAFHGRTSLAVAATDNSKIVAPVNSTEEIIRVGFNDIEALEDIFESQGNEIAAVIIEPIQGVGGIRIATDDLLRDIRKYCDEYGAVFIADEVQCGYGRTGKFYALDHSGVQADIYTMAKGMGNGFPIGGISIAPHLQPKHGMLGTTFGGNQLACAAALAVLEVMELEKLVDNAEKVGNYTRKQLAAIPHISNVRGRGWMLGFDVPEKFADIRKNLLHKHRIFTGSAHPNVVRLLPSLGLGREQADEFLLALRSEISFLNNKHLETISVSE